ncbi:hypothetical protein T03_3107 [Trichinella britovi]|uniref:Uncharacterized protein n=1 Tax=Trichinella britovi TaxID=45882 RepID=A0A0V0ZPH3_TRIBR|nr:hypothetical protein T03_3107 [Trichinella britovi]
MDTLIQQVLSGNVTVGDLRRRTLKQFLEALMYITPEPI